MITLLILTIIAVIGVIIAEREGRSAGYDRGYMNGYSDGLTDARETIPGVKAPDHGNVRFINTPRRDREK